jgi:hypothetical protein
VSGLDWRMPDELEPDPSEDCPVEDYLVSVDEGSADAGRRLAESLKIDLEDVRAILAEHGPPESMADLRGESSLTVGGPVGPAAELRGESTFTAGGEAFARAGVAQAQAFAAAVIAATAEVIPERVISRAEVAWNVEEARRPRRSAMTERQLMVIAVVLAATVIGALPADLRSVIVTRLDIAAALGALMELIRRAQQ